MIQINSREKKLLIVLGIVLGATLLYYAIISPIISFKQNADKSLENNIARISKLDELYSEYKQIQAEKNQLDIDAENSSVITTVSDIAASLNISGNKVYLKDTEGAVKNGVQLITTDLKFEGISIRNTLELIYRIENSGTPVKIKDMTITSGIRGKNRYDVVMKILSLTKR